MTDGQELSKELALTTKQQLFVDAFLSNGFNATQAAITAGYSPNSAEAEASRTLRKVKVRALIEAHLADAGITRERVLQEMADIAFRTDLADYEPVMNGESLQDLRGKGVDTRHIKKIKTSRRVVGTGKDAEPFEDVSLELKDATGMLDKLAKVLRLYDGGQPAGVKINSGGGPVQVNIPQGMHPIDELHILSQPGMGPSDKDLDDLRDQVENIEPIMPCGMDGSRE